MLKDVELAMDKNGQFGKTHTAMENHTDANGKPSCLIGKLLIGYLHDNLIFEWMIFKFKAQLPYLPDAFNKLLNGCNLFVEPDVLVV